MMPQKKIIGIYGGSGSEESAISTDLIPSPLGPAIAAELPTDGVTANTPAINSPFVAASTLEGFSPSPRII